MPNRTDIQEAHERAVLNAAVDEHNRVHGVHLAVIDRPDPPDGILSDGSVTTWIEVTDAFVSQDWARDLVSHVANEKHQRMPDGPYVDMDVRFAERFCDIVLQKAAKQSYKPFVSRYGPGLLVVGLETPWLANDTLDAIDSAWMNRGTRNVLATFAEVYLGYRCNGENRATQWLSR